MSVQKVGVIGAGFMGSGIAESVARAGICVSLHEPEAAPLARSRGRVARSIEHAVARGKLTAADAAEIERLLTWSTDLSDLADSDLVIEAVVEDEALKRQLFRTLDEVIRPGAVLASNTSSIPIAGLAAATRRRAAVLGLHFFSPAPVMKLVEVVASLDTSAATVEFGEAFVAQIGKTSIRTKDRSGFVVNMLLVPHLVAAVRMYEEGFATREDIDQGMKLGCGHPMGPLTLCDFIGLDVLHSICDSLYDEFKRPEYASPPLLKRMVIAGYHGRKTGCGFYTYQDERAAVAA